MSAYLHPTSKAGLRAVVVLLASLGSTAALAHTGIALRSFDNKPVADQLDQGRTVSANGDARALVAGPPMSPKNTCGGCHDYDTITSAYHFQLGMDEMVDADGDGFKDDFGRVATAEGGPLETLPTLRDIKSPGQLGAW